MKFTIFLDMDGVLTNFENVKLHQKKDEIRMSNKCPLDPKCVKLFNKIIDEFDIEIVMSSTWRHFDPIDKMKKKFKENKVKGKLVGYTPKTFRAVRGEEINFYVEEHNIKHYYVIDDETFDIDNIILEARIIHIENGWFDGGFKESHYNILRTRILQEIEYGES